jgi:hypothetical protein
LLSVSLSPCRRSHPAGVVRRVSQCATAHAAFTFPVAGSASGAAHFRGHLCVRLRYSLETRHHPTDGVVERLQEVGFPSPCSPSYRALAFPLVGLSPTEHASLRWTHNRTCHFHGTRLTREGHFSMQFSISPAPWYDSPWSACAFAGYLCTSCTTSSLGAFAIYVAFLRFDYYAPSDCLEGLGDFVWC